MIKKYVLDTNVLVHDPDAIMKFEDNDIFIPITVLEELDSLKKGHNGIGHSVRKALRSIDGLRAQGELSKGVRLSSGGMLKVIVPDNNAAGKPDDLIIRAAQQVNGDGNTFLVSKDVAVRVKAESLGVRAQDYKNDKVDISKIHGAVYKHNDERASAYMSIRYVVNADGALIRVHGADGKKFIKEKKSVFGVSAKNIEQTCALDAMTSDDIDVVALIGPAGTGKTLLALAAGLYMVTNKPAPKWPGDQRALEQVLVTRALVTIGKDPGTLPGDLNEKLLPYMMPIYDNLDVLAGLATEKDRKRATSRHLMDQGLIQIEPLAFMRGRSLPRKFLIVDEAQNLRPMDVKTILTRCGEDTKVVLMGDIDQIDTPYLDKESNGLTYLCSRFINEERFCYLNLTQTVRSRLAERASELL